MEHQLLEPWDSDTAPPTPQTLQTESVRAALIRWERERGLSVSLKDSITANCAEAVARRKLLNDYVRDPKEK